MLSATIYTKEKQARYVFCSLYFLKSIKVCLRIEQLTPAIMRSYERVETVPGFF